MPLLLGAAGAAEAPDTTLARVLHLVEAVVRRTAYLALLVENSMALSQLVKLAAASPWIAAYLARQPALLDELLDPRTLYVPLQRADLEAELRGRLEQVESGDQEAQMDALRRFKNGHVLRVAAADVAGVLPLMRVSDYLTEIAEVCLGALLEINWEYFGRRYGVPHYRLDGELQAAGFAVVAYGKLGGIELGYGSDLDLVFLHDSRGEDQYTDGAKAVDNPVFYARLGQRFIHMAETLTGAGVLYEVDMRLRPHGNSGEVASSLEAFAGYQRSEAWTWEHQALVRASLR